MLNAVKSRKIGGGQSSLSSLTGKRRGIQQKAAFVSGLAGGIEVYSKFAFTLAEVLITLGIIGVVAVMTLPAVIQNYRNHVVETRLAKFYSNINNAIRLAEVDYGDRKYWFDEDAGNSPSE